MKRLILTGCALLFACSADESGTAKTLHKARPNIYTDSGVAGWIWQGVSGEVENETQIWQLSLPTQFPNRTFPERFYPPLFPDQANWDIVTAGDFDGNGSADFLWRHKTTGAWRVWQMKNGIRQNRNDLPDFDAAHEWTVVGAGDTDKDGDDDVILNNHNSGQILIWEMQQHSLRASHIQQTKTVYRVSRIGDFNKDGDVDLMLYAPTEDRWSIWEIEANTLVQEKSVLKIGKHWVPACAGDADNDGDDDILLVNNLRPQERWQVIENYVRVKQLVGATPVGFAPAGCGDYDGDGDMDVLWRNPSSGRNRVVLEQDYGTRKRTIDINSFGGDDSTRDGYGFEYRGNQN